MNLPPQFDRARAWAMTQRAERPVAFWASVVLGGGVLLAVAGVLLLVLLVWAGAFGKLPSRAAVAAVEVPEASYLLDRNGKLLSRYYRENRELAALDEMPPALIEALLATEDERFFEHEGVDWQATARAIVYSGLLGQREQGGGSTISQQLAKNHFPRTRGGLPALVVAKVKEAITAGRFEREYSKEELLALYLNSVPFGENMYGVKVAARRFFDRELTDLRAEEAAVLVGMLKANSYYHPVWHPDRAVERRNLVLRRMEAQAFLTAAERDSLTALPLTLSERPERARAGASYLSERAKADIAAALQGITGDDGEPLDLYRDGLRIYTTVDEQLQTWAEVALTGHLEELQKTFFGHWSGRDPEGLEPLVAEAMQASTRWQGLLAGGLSEAEAEAAFAKTRPVSYRPGSALGQQEAEASSWRDSIRAEVLRLRAAVVVADPHGAAIRAYVGGTDFGAVPFNSAAARRQVGSTFKPVVYAAAVEDGAAPCEYFPNELRTYTDFEDWTPENADGEYGGEYSLTGALVNSVNTVAVQLAFRVGPRRIAALAEQLGLSGVPAEPSVALGTPSLSLEDMVRVYGTFARGGTVPEYRLVSRIETHEGEVVYEADEPESVGRVFAPHTARTLDYMLRQVASRGTGAGLRSRYGVQSEVAGKTGTTQNQADGWFVGYTRDLVVGAWVGGAYPNIRWRSLSQGQGARTALPVVGRFLRAYERKAGVSRLPEVPEDILWDADCPDHVDYGEDIFADEYEPGDFERLFDDIFRNRRQRNAPSERTDPRARAEPSPGAAERNRERARQREEANRRLEEARRERDRQRRSADRERRKEERRERRRRALERVFGGPD